ncbi:MAG TPA: tetratricopeptide repeat protein [Thermoanaerobaculia bacterium]|nr:tetratricopeptide repeat protein [Thermoanaerobaculia bacterium]
MSTDWVSALAILAAGLVLGALFVYFNKRRNAPKLGNERDLERIDLEAKRDTLVQQLRDSSLSAEERARLELETADTLRKLDAYAPSGATGSQPVDPPSPLAMNPTIKGFLWGAGSVAALAALAYFVMQQATPRQEGDELTGGFAQSQPPQQQTPAQQQNDPMIQQLRSAIQAQPNNLELRNELAQAYLENNDLMAVFQETKFVLAQSPEDSRALTLQGLVRMAMGETGEATQMLQRATRSNPKNLDSWVALAWVHAQAGRNADAQKMIDEAARQVPQEKVRLEGVWAQMQQQLAQRGAPQQMPEGHPPIAPDETPVPAAAGGGVQVTLDLDPAARTRSGIVFVIARNASGGPPVAVKRVVAGAFPINVELTSADSMMGQQLPATFRLEARLDADGDPMTKPPTDPAAMQDGVAPGATVRLSLK